MQVQEANFDFWWMSIHESCVGNMMNNFTSPYTLRPTFTQMALRSFIVFKWLYCPSHDLIGCERENRHIYLKQVETANSQRFAPIYMNDLNLQYKSFDFHEMHLLPKTLKLCVVHHMKVSTK